MKITIDMAREAGWDDHHAEFDTRLDRLVALVRADEREACAKVCETTAPSQINGYECADLIRARNEQ
jgi:hypothetical protein